MLSGALNGFRSSLNNAVSINFLKIGNAAFEPVSYFPNDLGSS